MKIEIKGIGEKRIEISPDDNRVCIKIIGIYHRDGATTSQVDLHTTVSAEELKAAVDSVTRLCKKKRGD